MPSRTRSLSCGWRGGGGGHLRDPTRRPQDSNFRSCGRVRSGGRVYRPIRHHCSRYYGSPQDTALKLELSILAIYMSCFIFAYQQTGDKTHNSTLNPAATEQHVVQCQAHPPPPTRLDLVIILRLCKKRLAVF